MSGIQANTSSRGVSFVQTTALDLFGWTTNTYNGIVPESIIATLRSTFPNLIRLCITSSSRKTHLTDNMPCPCCPHCFNQVTGSRIIPQELSLEIYGPYTKSTGTPYNCSQAEIDFHRSAKFTRPNEIPFVKPCEATLDMLVHNGTAREMPSAEAEAINRLLHAVKQAEKNVTTLLYMTHS